MSQQVPVQPVLACSQCGRTFPQSDVVQVAGNWVCADCKPAYLSRVMAGSASTGRQWHYGGFWIRFLGVFIDGLLIDVVYFVMVFLVMPMMIASRTARSNPAALPVYAMLLTFVPLLVAVLYEVIMIRKFGATLGKMVVGVKVVRTDGGGISWGISIARYLMKMVSGMILAIGYIMAGFDDQKRGLHDRVCDTRVIYKRGWA